MKTLQDHANEIAEKHWDREPLEIIKAEIQVHRSNGVQKRLDAGSYYDKFGNFIYKTKGWRENEQD